MLDKENSVNFGLLTKSSFASFRPFDTQNQHGFALLVANDAIAFGPHDVAKSGILTS